MPAVIHTSYDIENPPPRLDPSWTRFVCISDTHSTITAVPPGDVLLHGGDLSSWGTYKQLRKTLDWLMTLPHELKVIIAGNHDHCLDLELKSQSWFGGLDPEDVDQALSFVRSDDVKASGLVYLDHESTAITSSNGVQWTVYGSPAAPVYVEGAFQYFDRKEAKEEWARIPDNVEILMTHTPPHGILDLSKRGKQAGCRELMSKLQSLENCRLHVFGHIHEGFGAEIREMKKGENKWETVFVNAAVAMGNLPIIIDMKKD
ncbi:Metallo-dependent phosphatase [Schizopora paradoxa]|uniref:Metallo-dependent phosphatase n=1 Tax=Schizopora paradoxa TaxID=27342 RepID=A0A0H2RFU2_9AGAM|nr:Metallo-dependent phosphatase [Schizopora paradoxa]